MKRKKHDIQIKRLFKPMGWIFFLSVLYNIFYIYGSVFLGGWTVLGYAFLILLGMVSSVGLYWICTRIWQKPFSFEIPTILPILIIEGVVLVFTFGFLLPLHEIVYENDIWYISLIYQIVCALLVVLVQPLQLCMFTGLAQNMTKPRELLSYVKDRYLHSFKDVWNRYCLILLMIIFLDSLIGAPFSMASGFDGYSILTNILVFGNPMLSWMLAFFMAAGVGLNSSAIVYIFILFLTGILYMIVECNFLVKVGTTWIDYGTEKSKTHKKKK